ncbi:MAG: tetratricopeptide repeat protein [Acidobacteriota bacterium]
MEKKLIVILFALLFINWHWFEPVSRKNKDGIKAYSEKQYNKALESFLSAKGIKPGSVELMNNTASALFNLKKYQEAFEEFSKIDPEKTGISGSDFYYNTGNTQFRLNKLKEALESYKKSLIHDPDNIDTKKNFEITLKKIKEQDKNKKDEDKKDQKDKKKDEKYKNIMKYLNQKEKDQMKKIRRKSGKSKKTRDW